MKGRALYQFARDTADTSLVLSRKWFDVSPMQTVKYTLGSEAHIQLKLQITSLLTSPLGCVYTSVYTRWRFLDHRIVILDTGRSDMRTLRLYVA